MTATPNHFQIRRLVSKDLAAFRDIRQEAVASDPRAFGSHLCDEALNNESWYLERLTSAYVVGGLRLEEDMLGTITLSRNKVANNGRVAALSGMYVRPAARGTGLARDLLDAAIIEAFRNCNFVLLAVGISNDVATRLYRSAGFRKWKIDPPMAGIKNVSQDEVLMRLDRE